MLKNRKNCKTSKNCKKVSRRYKRNVPKGMLPLKKIEKTCKNGKSNKIRKFWKIETNEKISKKLRKTCRRYKFSKAHPLVIKRKNSENSEKQTTSEKSKNVRIRKTAKRHPAVTNFFSKRHPVTIKIKNEENCWKIRQFQKNSEMYKFEKPQKGIPPLQKAKKSKIRQFQKNRKM